MTLKKNFIKTLIVPVVCAGLSVVSVSCSDDDGDVVQTYPVVFTETIPEGVPAGYTVKSGSVTYSELNTGKVYNFTLPLQSGASVPAGTYDIDATMTVNYPGEEADHTLRAVASQQVVSGQSQAITLAWFHYNPANTLVFGEIYFAGSPNAAGTNGLYDTYFTIYNNTDEIQYADGIAIVESKFFNTSTDRILTAENMRDANFTVQTVYVVPGSGRDVAVNPGQSIKIVDQAIDWNAVVNGALDHRDADFEWYDEVTTGTVRDTDNPDVPNLDKWFSYSKTIWIPSNQCNRSYALVRFPEGMTVDRFLAEQKGDYQYINAATGKTLNGTNAYLVKHEWIIDGVNLCTTEGFTEAALAASVDAGYAAISDKKTDKNRFGRRFVRKTSGVSALGNTVLMDTNDSARDFDVVSAK